MNDYDLKWFMQLYPLMKQNQINPKYRIFQIQDEELTNLSFDAIMIAQKLKTLQIINDNPDSLFPNGEINIIGCLSTTTDQLYSLISSLEIDLNID